MKGYKAFGKGMVCRGKQYAENTVFEEESAELCESGMHFCENPLDVLDYYPLINDDGEFTEVAEVEADEKDCKTDGKKTVTTKLKIGAKISLKEFVKASVDFLFEKSTSDYSSGDYAKIGSSGEDCVICCAGADSKAKAKKGSWITLAEWKYDGKKQRYVPACVKTEYVDGKRIKEDVFYRIQNGEFKEVDSK